MCKYCILIALFIYSSKAISQDLSPIEIDRPDQTECPSIVPKGIFQMENGLNFEKKDSNSNFYLLPTTLWKVGINENLELRLITEFAIENTDSERFVGLKPIFIGLKVKICEEKGIIPKTSLIAHILLPKVASEKFKVDYIAPKFRFTMQHTLSDKISLSYNLGAEWNGETPETTFIYTLTTGYKLTEKVGAYTEIYGFAPQNNKPDHRCDAGFTYLINNNSIIDISGGFGITSNAPKQYISLGFSFRI